MGVTQEGWKPTYTPYTLQDLEVLYHVCQEHDGSTNLEGVVEINEMTWKEPEKSRSSVNGI